MKPIAFAILLALLQSGAIAGNSLIAPDQAVIVAKSPLKVKPAREWNKLGARLGRNAETWTIDGDTLNDLTFYGGIESGKTLFEEIDKHNRPLPRFSKTMLLTDVPSLLENSYRIALDTSLMEIGKIEVTQLAGRKAVRFEYRFVAQSDDVRRRGEAYAIIVKGKLFMISFEAPELYYFDANIESARQVINSAALPF